MKKFLRVCAFNIMVALAAVIAYSPGLLNLRPGAESILTAGLSIIVGIALAAGFVGGNVLLLGGSVRRKMSVSMDDGDAYEKTVYILKSYKNGRYFGKYAAEALNQKERLDKSVHRANEVIKSHFEPGSMSYQRFYSVVQDAGDTALSNLVAMANRLQVFDEDDYQRLQHYKEDDIPDDIQEEQIKLYSKNLDLIQSTLRLNENIIFKLDSLAMSLGASDSEENDYICKDIETLIQESKYY